MTARRSEAVAVAAVVTALLVVVLAAWAASIGPSGVLTGAGPSPVGTPTDSRSVDAGARASVPPQPEPEHHTPGWVRVAAFVLDLAVAVLAVYLILRYLAAPLGRFAVRRRRERLRRRRLGPAADEDFTVLDPVRAVAEQMLADAGAQREELLAADTPRNAVVVCWHRFETQAAAAGVARQPWETSSEYTMRVLDLVDAHQPAVSRLGALYREARFSEHELTEAHRREALEALDAIHRTVRLPAGVAR